MTRFEVKNQSTLQAARELVTIPGASVAILNFASAKHPGGGFRTGARAQEESIARASGLFSCLNGHPMYPYHQARSDPFYSDYAIYSPSVPVFRDDVGNLLSEPMHCGIVTAPAVNAGAVRKRKVRYTEIVAEMASRIHKVLAIFAHHGHNALVLGAWGCGVFRNRAEDIAELFAQALGGAFQSQFYHVKFAVLDYSDTGEYIDPFERRFGSRCL